MCFLLPNTDATALVIETHEAATHSHLIGRTHQFGSSTRQIIRILLIEWQWFEMTAQQYPASSISLNRRRRRHPVPNRPHNLYPLCRTIDDISPNNWSSCASFAACSQQKASTLWPVIDVTQPCEPVCYFGCVWSLQHIHTFTLRRYTHKHINIGTMTMSIWDINYIFVQYHQNH